MKSCKLPKAVTDAAIPRRVRAACEIHGGERVFFVRGDDGRPTSRFFATGRGFASHIRHSYKPVTLGSSGSFVEARSLRDRLEAETAKWEKALKHFPRGAMGLTPDHVKSSPEFIATKSAFDHAFSKLRQFNSMFTKKFARELQEERRQRRAQPLGNYGVTKEELIKQTKQLHEEAFKADPYHTEEVVERVLGRTVFVWHNLSTAQLSALRRGILATALAARGV